MRGWLGLSYDYIMDCAISRKGTHVVNAVLLCCMVMFVAVVLAITMVVYAAWVAGQIES